MYGFPNSHLVGGFKGFGSGPTFGSPTISAPAVSTPAISSPEAAEPINSRAEEYRSPGDNSSPAGETIPAGIGASSYDGKIVWWSGFDANASTAITSFAMVFKDCLFAPSFTLVKMLADEQLIISTVAPLRQSGQTIRFYNGTQTAVDPVLTAALGASMASAWPGYVYAVFENFDCSAYGNRVPLIRAVLAGSVTAVAAAEDQSTLSFGAFGGGYSNTAFTVDPVKGHHYQIVQAGDVASTLTIDFVNTYAEVDGVEVPWDDLDTIFTGGAVDAGGFYGHNLDPSNGTMIGDALAVFTNDEGITVVIEYYLPQLYEDTGMNINLHTEATNQFNITNSEGSEFWDGTGPDTGMVGGDQVGVTRIAISANGTNYHGSQNGSAATTCEMGAPAAFSSSSAIAAVVLFTLNGGDPIVDGPRIRSIAVYPYTPPADLPALSGPVAVARTGGASGAWLVTVDIATLQEINRVRIFAAGFGIVSFPVALFGTDYIACSISEPKVMPALLNVQTGEIVATLEPNTTGDAWECTPKRAAMIGSWGATKFVVIVEHALGPGFTGNHMGLFVADTTSGTMEWIIHPYASPAAGSGSISGAAEFSVEWGPTVDGVISLWYTDLDNIYTALISATGFTSGLFYAEPDPAKTPLGLAYDPTRNVLAVYRQDGSWLKLNAANGAVISTTSGAITDFNINHWADDVDTSTTYNAFYHSHRPGFIVATRGPTYGDIYEVSLSTFTATLLIDRSDFSNDDIAIYFDQYAGVMTEGSATAGIINRVTLGDTTPNTVDLVDIFTQLATFDGRCDVGDLDFTGFPGNETSGLKLDNDTTIDNLEQSIAEVFDVKTVESDGKRKYIYPPRDGSFAIDIVLDPEDFVENGAQTIEKTFGAGEDEFVGCTVQYFDKDSDYKKLEQSYRRPLGVYDVTRSKKRRTVNTMLSLSAGQATQLATIAVFRSVLGNETYSFSLVPGLAHVEPADIATFDFRGFTTIARIKEASLGANYTQDVTAYQFLQFAEATFTGASLALPAEEDVSFSTRLIYLDVPLLFYGHDLGGAGLVEYAQIAGYGTGAISGTLYKSPDGATFTSQGAVSSVEPVVGVITAISGTPTDPFVKDEINSIAVVVGGGDVNDLVTISDDQFDAGVNIAAIGRSGRWVLLWFQSVSISSGTATLSDLMWGVRGSEVWVGDLAVGDQFVLLNPSHYIRFRNAVADLGDSFLYKAGNPVFSLAVIPTVSYVASGVAETPYAPTNLAAEIDGSDIDLSWDYRSRLVTGINPANHGEASLAFEIDIMDGGTVTRTLTATTNAKTYLAADITADFGGMPDGLTFRVYMMSAVVGRGYMGVAIVNFTPGTADETTVTADSTTITADAG